MYLSVRGGLAGAYREDGCNRCWIRIEGCTVAG